MYKKTVNNQISVGQRTGRMFKVKIADSLFHGWSGREIDRFAIL